MKTKIISFIIIASIAMQSCYTRHMTSSTTSPDYNKRVYVNGAGIRKKPSKASGIVFSLSVAGIGGAIGSQMPTKVTDEGKETTPAGNATTWALLGGLAGYVMFVAAIKEKTVPVTDPKQWMRWSNMENYKLLKSSGNNFTFINPSIESDYKVNNIQDVRDFRIAFPNSIYTEKTLVSAVDKLSETDWNELIALSPATSKQSVTAKISEIQKAMENARRELAEKEAKRKAETAEKERISKTFTYFAKDYIEPKINRWQEKGEFEKTVDWQWRVNETTRNAKIAELQKEAEREYLIVRSKDFNIGDMTLGKYDADNETFLIKNSVYGDWLVPVPSYGNEAEYFKSNWNNINKAAQFFIRNDMIAISGMTFTTRNGKKYRYSNEASLNYQEANISYNFAPIEIEAPKTSEPKGKQTISNTNISIGKSDVATNIPTTSNKNDKTLALIIANEDYNYVSPVMYAKNDGEIFRQYCIKTLGLLEENVTYIPNATLGVMRREIKQITELAETYNGEANIIFYYAGHGFPDEKDKTAYLIPVDGNGNDKESGYKVERLYKQFGETSAKTVTVFLYACFSGTQRNGGMLVEARGIAIKPKETAPLGNTIVFSAADGDETAHPYTEKEHGMFTYFLLKKLQETKGDVTLGELNTYITENVRQTSQRINRKKQTPTVTTSISFSDNWKVMKLK